MNYAIKEAFYSLQGEGAHSGRPSVFVRFAGCNLGYSVCPWCDTDWTGTDGPHGGRYDAPGLAALARSLSPTADWCVLTGGEPALQADWPAVNALRSAGFAVAIETSGTVRLKTHFNWETVSPKAGTTLAVTRADEVKVAFPQSGLDPSDFAGLADLRYVQPIDGPDLEANTRAAIAYCLANPGWRLSEQGHKRWGLK